MARFPNALLCSSLLFLSALPPRVGYADDPSTDRPVLAPASQVDLELIREVDGVIEAPLFATFDVDGFIHDRERYRDTSQGGWRSVADVEPFVGTRRWSDAFLATFDRTERVLLQVEQFPEADGPAVVLRRWRAADLAQGTGTVAVSQYDVGSDWDSPREVVDSGCQFQAQRPDGRWCGSCGDSLRCFDLDETTGSIGWEDLVTTEDLEEIFDDEVLTFLSIPGWYLGASTEPTPYTTPTWTIGRPTFDADGNAWFRLDLQFDGFNLVPGQWNMWMRRSATGELTVEFGPWPTSVGNSFGWFTPSGLDGGRTLFVPGLESAAVVQSRLDYSPFSFERECPGGVTQLGWAGYGLRLVTDDGAETGFLPLTEPMLRHLECSGGVWVYGCRRATAGGMSFFNLPDGDVGVALAFFEPEGAGAGTRIYRVVLDPDELDLDGDGLRGDDEAALGTNPWRYDTDEGGTSDRMEAYLGSDPAAPTDDESLRARREAEGAMWVASPLIRRQLACDPPASNGWSLSGSAGPLCCSYDAASATSCIGPDGQTISEVPGGTGRSPWRHARDGLTMWQVDDEGVGRFDHRTGTFETVISGSTLADVLPDPEANYEVAPVDAERAFVVTPDDLQIAYFDGMEFTRIADVNEWACEAGMGECDEDTQPFGGNAHAGLECSFDPESADRPGAIPVHSLEDAARGDLRVYGWMPDLERLLIGIDGHWDAWVIAVHPAEPPQVLFRKFELLRRIPTEAVGLDEINFVPEGFDAYFPPAKDQALAPWGITPTGQGDWLAAGFEESAGAYLMGPYTSFQTGRFEHPPFGRLPLRVWGDTYLFVDAVDQSSWELVRYQAGLDPGDVVAVAPKLDDRDAPVIDEEGLYAVEARRAGARGGLAWLFDPNQNRDGRLRLPGPVSDVAVSGAGHVAWASDGVWIFPPDEARGGGPAPDALIANFGEDDSAAVVAVGFDADDDLHVLFVDFAGGEAVVSVLDPDSGEELSREVVAGSTGGAGGVEQPFDAFVRRPDGSLERWVAGTDGLASIAYMPDGRRVGLRATSERGPVTPDGNWYGPLVEVDGEPVQVIPEHGYPSSAVDPEGSPVSYRDIVVRADGLIVVPGPTHVWTIDPTDGDLEQLGIAPMPFAQLALRPGGDAENPWISGWESPASDAPGGDDGAENNDDESSEEQPSEERTGCCAVPGHAPQESPWSLLVAVLVLTFIARRRQHQDRSMGSEHRSTSSSNDASL